MQPYADCLCKKGCSMYRVLCDIIASQQGIFRLFVPRVWIW